MNPSPAPRQSPVHIERIIDNFCDQFEDDWKAGRRPRIEDYLGGVAHELQPELLRELLQVEVDIRTQAGEKPAASEYRDRLARVGEWALAILTELLPEPDDWRVTLTVIEGPNKGKSKTFAEHNNYVAGRSLESHLVLPDDKYFSRSHFLVEVNPPNCRLIDLRSKNHTYHNGSVVERADLADGDEIRAGTMVIRVCVIGKAPPSPSAKTITLGPDAPAKGEETQVLPPGGLPPIPTIPGYRIEGRLGAGGMGVVYKAIRLSDGKVIALKTIRPAIDPPPTLISRFLREADILRQLQHPLIVSLHNIGAADGLLYFAMDFVEGTDAARLVEKGGPLPVPRAVSLTLDLLTALKYAHGARSSQGEGFVHRDVKPGNLLVTNRDGRETGVLADFGLAKAYQASPLSGLTVSGTACGTLHYMAPEQVRDFRSAKPAADQYAAGCTLYYLLTGHNPYDPVASQNEFFSRLLDDEVGPDGRPKRGPAPLLVRRPDLPQGVVEAVERAMSRRVDQRFPDVDAFRRTLAPFAVG